MHSEKDRWVRQLSPLEIGFKAHERLCWLYESAGSTFYPETSKDSWMYKANDVSHNAGPIDVIWCNMSDVISHLCLYTDWQKHH